MSKAGLFKIGVSGDDVWYFILSCKSPWGLKSMGTPHEFPFSEKKVNYD